MLLIDCSLEKLLCIFVLDALSDRLALGVKEPADKAGAALSYCYFNQECLMSLPFSVLKRGLGDEVSRRLDHKFDRFG